MKEYLKKRLEEKTTWAGFSAASAAVLTLAATFSSFPQWVVATFAVVMGVCGFVAVIVPK
jgi:hypothetical protein